MRAFVSKGWGAGMSALILVLSLGLWASGCGSGGMIGSAPAPELGEPQGDSGPGGARTLDSITTEQGYIEYVGDSDWFHLDIPSDVDTLLLELSNQALESPVDLSLTVYESDENGNLGGILGGRYDPNGGDGQTGISLELAVEEIDSVYVVVRDHGGENTDPLNPYFLKATFFSGPGDDNNSPETAVFLDCGVPLQEAIQANGDLDWFQVQFPSSADILAISLSMPAGSPDLSLTLYDSNATTAMVFISDSNGTDGPTSWSAPWSCAPCTFPTDGIRITSWPTPSSPTVRAPWWASPGPAGRDPGAGSEPRAPSCSPAPRTPCRGGSGTMASA